MKKVITITLIALTIIAASTLKVEVKVSMNQAAACGSDNGCN